MNSKQLQYFLATSHHGSITAAARYLDVAQPAISLQLANLEHELKVKLFNRDFRGVELTEHGKKFECHAQLIIQQIQEAKNELAGVQEECKGKVILGLSQSICNVLSVELLTELEHRFANIELTFRVGTSYKIDKWLAQGSIDIAVSYNPIPLGRAPSVIKLIREELFLYISKQPQNPLYSELSLYGSIPFNDIQHYDIFMPEQQDALSQLLFSEAQKANIKLKPKKAFGQLMTTLHYVTQGLGLMISPSSSAFHLELSNQIRAINIIQPDLQRDVYLQLSEQKSSDITTKAVYELIREITAITHANHYWRGTLLDSKYILPSLGNIETLVTS